MPVWGCVSHSVMFDSFRPPMDHKRLLCPWNSPGKNTRVGCHSLLQGIFPTEGSNPGFLHSELPGKSSDSNAHQIGGNWVSITKLGISRQNSLAKTDI